MKSLDKSMPYGQVFGVGRPKYRFVQDGAYFDIHGARVDPETGRPWSAKQQEDEDFQLGIKRDAKAFAKAALKDQSTSGAAKAAIDGIALPRRILSLKKGA